MKTIHTTTFLLIFTSWILLSLSDVFANNSENKAEPFVLSETNESKPIPPDLVGITENKEVPSVIVETSKNKTLRILIGKSRENKELPPTLSGMNENKPLPLVLSGTNENKTLSRVLSGTNENKTRTPILRETNRSKQLPRVLGGTPADRIEFAYVAQVFNNKALCGGTIVTARSVLTASHCFIFNADPQYIIIAVGNTGKTVLDPKTRKLPIWDLFTHEEFDETGFLANDIALLFVEPPITLGYAVRRALLVDTDEFLNETEAEFVFAGWGTTTYPPVVMSQIGLQRLNFELVPIETCEEIHNDTFSDEVFCLYKGEGEDTCSGDSGGGVKWDGMIVGIVSCGDGCGTKDMPGLYTNVYEYLDWIEDRLETITRRVCSEKGIPGGT